jgi:hypothetical protein
MTLESTSRAPFSQGRPRARAYIERFEELRGPQGTLYGRAVRPLAAEGLVVLSDTNDKETMQRVRGRSAISQVRGQVVAAAT